MKKLPFLGKMPLLPRLLVVVVTATVTIFAALGYAANLDLSSVKLTVLTNKLDDPELSLALSGDGVPLTGDPLTVEAGTEVRGLGALSDGSSAPLPTGSVTYRIFSGATCGTAYDDLDPVPLDAGTVQESQGSTITLAGTYSWRARYGGDGYNQPATSDCLELKVTAADPHALFFEDDGQPNATRKAGQEFDDIVVRVEDEYGNPVTDSTGIFVTLSLTPLFNTTGAALDCAEADNKAEVDEDGFATFTNCFVDKVGTGYRFTAASGTLEEDESDLFAITPGDPYRLEIVWEPDESYEAGEVFDPDVLVKVYDEFDNLVDDVVTTIALGLGENPDDAGDLLGDTSEPTVSGIATFANVYIEVAEDGYTLVATSAALTSEDSDPFDITPGDPDELVLVWTPEDEYFAGDDFGVIKVEVQDEFGNLVDDVGVGVTLGFSGGDILATLACEGGLIQVSSQGVAEFNECWLNKAATDYKLVASATSVDPVQSLDFDVVAADPDRLVFLDAFEFVAGDPDDTIAGESLAAPTGVRVRVEDEYGNVVTENRAVTVNLEVNPGNLGLLEGTLTVTTSNGIATFTNLSIKKALDGYRLGASASSPNLSGSSALFGVVPAAANKLVFTTQPSASTAAGVSFAAQPVVEVQDQHGNQVATSTAAITLAVTGNPAGVTLDCGTNPLNASSGVASFSGCDVNKIGTYTLNATSAPLTAAGTDPFSITHGPAAKLVFTSQPSGSTQAGVVFATQPVIEVRDQFDQLATTSNASVQLAIATGPSGAVLNCDNNTLTPTGGIVTLAGCDLNLAGDYTLTATSSGLTPFPTTSTFTITAAAATQLKFGQQPTNTNAGATMSAITVRVEDSFGNLVTTAATPVTIAIGFNPSSGALSGTLSVNASGGIATFSDLSINNAGVAYTLSASGLGSVTSTPFDIL